MPSKEEWLAANLGTGLRTEYDFTIHMATFGTDMSYNNGQSYLLILSGLDEDNTESQEMLSIGEGWESKDGGFTATHEKKALFNRNSVYGVWLGYAAEAVEAAGQDWIFNKDPRDASMWNGTRWHMEEKVIAEASTWRDGTEHPARTRLVPVAFLGFEGDAPASTLSGVVSEAPVPTQAPASNGAVVDGSPILLALAKASPDYQSFVNAAMTNPDVANDEALLQLVIDGSPNGYYSTHH